MASEIRYVVFTADDVRAICQEQNFPNRLPEAASREAAARGRTGPHWLAQWCRADADVAAVLVEVFARACRDRRIALPRAGAKRIETHGDAIALKISMNVSEVEFTA